MDAEVTAKLAELMAENELLRAHVGTLERRDYNHRTHIWQLQQALTPFAQQMLSSDPDFHRTRPFSLEQHDRQILEARMAMRRRPGDDPLDELARINQEIGLDQ